MTLEHVHCPICGIDAGSEVLSCPDEFGYFKEVFTLKRCSGCNLVYINPRPDEKTLNDAYSSREASLIVNFAKQKINKDAKHGLDVLVAKRFIKQLDEIVPIKPDTKILDVGCSFGMFLFRARALKTFQAMGVDVSQPFVDYARKELGLENIFLGRLQEWNIPAKTIDVVRLWHVLEHLTDPIAMLSEIKRILKDDGIFILQVPCYRNVIAKIFRSHWVFYSVPVHLYHFTPETIAKILTKAGFDVIKIEGELMPFEISGSLFRLLGGNLVKFIEKVESAQKPTRGRRILYSILFWFLVVLFLPYLLLESLVLFVLSKTKWAGNMTAFCRKPR
jgi:2-polyprenyl-3-methyl-5-hydroxy-6-metoxy-1,4-benzoquinol methylase